MTRTITSNGGALTGNGDGTDLEQIMQTMRVGDKKSNLVDVDMNLYFRKDPAGMIAYLLEQSNNISGKIYRINFDPVQEILLKKMITNEFLDKRIIIEEQDFFKGTIALDYYCSAIAGNYEILDEMYKFAKALEKKDRKLDPKIEDVKNFMMEDLLQKNILLSDGYESGFRRKYARLNEDVDLENAHLRKPSPIYLGVAKIIVGCVDNLQDYLGKISSRIDIKALVFTDSIYSLIDADEHFYSVRKYLDRGNFKDASMAALKIASKNYYNKRMEEKLRRHS